MKSVSEVMSGFWGIGALFDKTKKSKAASKKKETEVVSGATSGLIPSIVSVFTKQVDSSNVVEAKEKSSKSNIIKKSPLESFDSFLAKQIVVLEQNLEDGVESFYIIGGIESVEHEIHQRYQPENLAQWRDLAADSFERFGLIEAAALFRGHASDESEQFNEKIKELPLQIRAAKQQVAPEQSVTISNNQLDFNKFIKAYEIALKESLSNQDFPYIVGMLESIEAELLKRFPTHLADWRNIIIASFENSGLVELAELFRTNTTKNISELTPEILRFNNGLFVAKEPAKKKSTYAALGMKQRIWKTLKQVGLELGLLKERKPWAQFLKEYQAALAHAFSLQDLNTVKQLLKAGEENVRYWYPDAALPKWYDMVAESFGPFFDKEFKKLELLFDSANYSVFNKARKGMMGRIEKLYPKMTQVWCKRFDSQFFQQKFQQRLNTIATLGGDVALFKGIIINLFPEQKEIWDKEVTNFILHYNTKVEITEPGYETHYKGILMPANMETFLENEALVKRVCFDFDKFIQAQFKKLSQGQVEHLVKDVEKAFDMLFNLPLAKNKEQILEYVLHEVYALAINVYLKTKDKGLYVQLLDKIRFFTAYYRFDPVIADSMKSLDKYDQLANHGSLLNAFLSQENVREILLEVVNQAERSRFRSSVDEAMKNGVMLKLSEFVISRDQGQYRNLEMKFANDRLILICKTFAKTSNKKEFDFNKYRVDRVAPFEVMKNIDGFFAASADYFKDVKGVFKILKELDEIASNAHEAKSYIQSEDANFKLNTLQHFVKNYCADERLEDLDFIRQGKVLENADAFNAWYSRVSSKIHALSVAVKESKNNRIYNFYFQHVLPFLQPTDEIEASVTRIIKSQISNCWNVLLKEELKSDRYSAKDQEFLFAINRPRPCAAQAEEDMMEPASVMTY